MKLIDICVNLQNNQFQNDIGAIVERALQHDVGGMLLTATSVECVGKLLPWCESGTRYCTAGVHPHDAASLQPEWLDQLVHWLQHDAIRAVGETGLDFNRNYSPRAVQIDVFDAQIRLAQVHGLPLFVHDRDSGGEVLRRLRLAERDRALPPVVIHCFTGTRAELAAYLEADFYVGITGWVCDARRGKELRRVVSDIPLDRLLIETDAPFLRPHTVPETWHQSHGLPAKHKRRNEPALLPYVLQTIAEHRLEPMDLIARATTDNAQRLFGFELEH